MMRRARARIGSSNLLLSYRHAAILQGISRACGDYRHQKAVSTDGEREICTILRTRRSLPIRLGSINVESDSGVRRPPGRQIER